jgi:hypothetical protein
MNNFNLESRLIDHHMNSSLCIKTNKYLHQQVFYQANN